jgi:hypothetical protein
VFVDPVTAAIVAAVATGLTSGVKKIGENVVTDAYNALKSALQRKFGSDKKLVKAIKAVEEKPDSEAKQRALEARMVKHHVEYDPELLRLAENLKNAIYVTNINMQAGDHATQMYGNGNIGAVHGSQVFINQRHVAPSANDLLQHGVQLLRAGAYEESVAPLNQSLVASPSSDANYYLALATLRGQRPRALTYSLAKAVEGRLQAACRLDPHKGHYWYLLALVKYDFFIENGFLDDVDEINDLLSTGDACPLMRGFIVELLHHVPAKNCPVYEIIQDRL